LTKFIKCRRIVGGTGRGKLLCTKIPINFLSGVNLQTGEITDQLHDLLGFSMKEAILVFPHAVGSSVGAYSIFALGRNSVAPSGIICTSKVDLITASGCAIAGIPLVQITNKNNLWKIYDGKEGAIDANNCVLEIKKFK
jgi:phosphomecalonate degydratase small subunit